MHTLTDLAKAFDFIDLDGNGRINQEELAAFLRGSGDVWNDDQIRLAFTAADTDGDGTIDRLEFTTLMIRMSDSDEE